jgi:HSP20 family protein
MNELRPSELFDVDPMDFAFRHLLRPWRGQGPERAPQIRIDLSETEQQYVVKAEIPGVTKEAIDVRIDGNQVTISTEIKKEKEEKKDGRVLRSERQYGYASRAFTLDADVDDAKAVAKYENGVLTLTLPKKPSNATKRLPVA